ncbi:unnamed protein product [Caretta caretta]
MGNYGDKCFTAFLNSLKVAFSQHNTIMDLVQFFVTFFSCFLSLLLVAAVVWKIKQTCWASRRREVSITLGLLGWFYL